ncbi:hypothetical protein NI454_07435 [Brevundimonas diminuta]|jgi:uncharacterized protein YodC (DUF2158 family)|uniref:hypothetical protein n=1 Tax=Brevundimonas diminuta TaxID=293 RepID=UPI0020976DD8|nr:MULTISPECIES: hypothetical protein [Brevundimonas]MCO8029786.1 hypothetical protein [Brevundimonas diminuta]
MRTAVLIAVMLAAPLGAQASDRGRGVEAMQATFGNTVVSHYPNGNWVKHWFDRDGAYRALFSDGRRLTARWAQEGDKICLNEIRPRMIISRFCTPYIEVSVGETWSGRDPLGRRVRNELVAGR